jgi:hypothetical protein
MWPICHQSYEPGRRYTFSRVGAPITEKQTSIEKPLKANLIKWRQYILLIDQYPSPLLRNALNCAGIFVYMCLQVHHRMQKVSLVCKQSVRLLKDEQGIGIFFDFVSFVRFHNHRILRQLSPTKCKLFDLLRYSPHTTSSAAAAAGARHELEDCAART